MVSLTGTSSFGRKNVKRPSYERFDRRLSRSTLTKRGPESVLGLQEHNSIAIADRCSEANVRCAFPGPVNTERQVIRNICIPDAIVL
jgi:hypothetical protein